MWFPILITVLTGYLLGNLNGAVLMSNLLAHEDVRTQGSGNAGLTNFARNYGGLGSFGVIAIDGIKAALACLAGGLMLVPYDMWAEGMAIGGLALMVGHDFPVLLGFRGGKGILSGCIIAFVIDWRVGLLVLGVFAVLYLLTRYVSLGSVVASATFAVGFAVFRHDRPVVMLCGIAMGLLAVYMHRGNILRLLQGNERKTDLFKKGSKK
ncbi:MAG: glycerol-3-phosphate acyltransferase [Oscillospiraceae bacterium]|nr:glycerol-3-phosphate acyltransferase [Oscillospiraceae bacterium]MBQ5712431.1 glycerol-3-phosphate acyltransferase [Oscillospiraceae bacterium]